SLRGHHAERAEAPLVVADARSRRDAPGRVHPRARRGVGRRLRARVVLRCHPDLRGEGDEAVSAPPISAAVLSARREAGAGLRLVTLTPPLAITQAYRAP